jgi:ribosomal protein L11 methyltransferase
VSAGLPDEKRYPYVHVEVSADEADLMSSVLFELGATGVEERDDSTYVKGPAGRVLLIASFDTHDEAHAAIASLPDHGATGTLHEVVGDAWRDEWKKFYEPFALTPSILVKPPWLDVLDGSAASLLRDPQGNTLKTLVLEPGRAFGTGLHATTSLVANLLEKNAAALTGKALLDAGCGSGILSFVALLLGASRVVAFDIDPEAAATVEENAQRNSFDGDFKVFAGTVDDVTERFPWVVANIESRILDPMANELVSKVEPGGDLILSGILTAEEEWMRTRFTSLSHRFEVVDTAHMATGGERAYDKDGWVALHLRSRPS